ncbi:MAG TPA: class I SAM-dependent methyltransferase [Bacillota bacterium]|nr:class I SAM-dependent methyltransferase [Bacillota bacterium]
MINIVLLSHQILKSHPNPRIALDMTCGHGYDTLFLSSIAEHVYAFDIQDEAINDTKRLLVEHQITNVNLFKESHDLFDIFVSQNIDLAIYNLGYLPSGNRDIKTSAPIVINSLNKALERLNKNGIVVIVIYLHDMLESEAIMKYASNLGPEFDSIRHDILNKEKSPYIIEIRKI